MSIEEIIATAATWALCKAAGGGGEGVCDPDTNCVCGGEGKTVAPAILAALDAAGYAVVEKPQCDDTDRLPPVDSIIFGALLRFDEPGQTLRFTAMQVRAALDAAGMLAARPR